MKNLRLSFLLFSAFLVGLCGVQAQAQLRFDKPKTEPPLDNPYTVAVQREMIVQNAQDVLKTCKIALDENLSHPTEGKLITKPVVFTRGVTVKADLEHLADMPAGDLREWQQGRYALEITILPLDQNRSQLLVAAHIQGKVADASGSGKWIEGQSTGILEDEVLRGLAGKILGIDLSIKGNSKRRILSCEY